MCRSLAASVGCRQLTQLYCWMNKKHLFMLLNSMLFPDIKTPLSDLHMQSQEMVVKSCDAAVKFSHWYLNRRPANVSLSRGGQIQSSRARCRLGFCSARYNRASTQESRARGKSVYLWDKKSGSTLLFKDWTCPPLV